MYFGWFTSHEIGLYGRFGDFLWKGTSAAAIYLHFFARYKAIPNEEQGRWSPLLMGFYPDTERWAVRSIIRMQALLRLKPRRPK